MAPIPLMHEPGEKNEKAKAAKTGRARKHH
jgi:hypothetical protein